LVLLHVVNVISAFTECYPVNDQEYCFYTDDSALYWDDAREFCRSRNSTLPIITDEDIDNVFQRFISDSNNVNYVWLDAHAQFVNDSSQLHWINGKASTCSNRTLFLSLKHLISFRPIVLVSACRLCENIMLYMPSQGKPIMYYCRPTTDLRANSHILGKFRMTL